MDRLAGMLTTKPGDWFEMPKNTVIETSLPGLSVKRGKVRDVYEFGDDLLLVATDRISAFDVVLPTPIPGKGKLLTDIAAFWFGWLADEVDHHLIEVLGDDLPAELRGYESQLTGRTMRCRRTEVVPIEFVVRGYLAGSGWKDYQRTGSVCGVPLPDGLEQCAKLPEPIFTPATKAAVGHDENITFDQACDIVGDDTMAALAESSVHIYKRAARYALERGIIIADTKFEWGRYGDGFLLIDEVLTPDSSRFWPADDYEPGRDQQSFDKQYVRNYLETLVAAGKWDKTPPGPTLPDEVVTNTLAKYREAAERVIM